MGPEPHAEALNAVPGLADLVRGRIHGSTDTEVASLSELVLEALHQHSLLGKDTSAGEAIFTDMMGSMLSGLSKSQPDEDEPWDPNS
jgi:magnesium chelatase subunit I